MADTEDKLTKAKKSIRQAMGVSQEQPVEDQEPSLLQRIRQSLFDSKPLDDKISDGLKKFKKK